MCPLCGAFLAMKDSHTKEQVLVEGFLLGATVLRLQETGDIPPLMETLCEAHKAHMHRLAKFTYEADPAMVPDVFKKQVAFVVGPQLKVV